MVVTLIGEDELRREFKTFGIDLKDDAVIDKLREMCQLFKLDAETLVETWMAFVSSNQYIRDIEPTVEMLTLLENQKLLNKKNTRTKDTPSTAAKRQRRVYDASSIDELMDIGNLMQSYGTPEVLASEKRLGSPESVASKKLNGEIVCEQKEAVTSSPNMPSSNPSTKYVSRENSGDVVCKFGNTERAYSIGKNSQPVSVVPYSEEECPALTNAYLYMFETMHGALEYLDGRIVCMEDVYKAEHEMEELAHVRLPSADAVGVVGRICCDSNGRLNASSVLLEGSLKSSAGSTVELDVSYLKSYSLFPGQILALSAVNNTGRRLVAKEVYAPVVPAFPTGIPDFATKAEPLSLIVAAGPFTTSDSLSYKPLEDFLEIVRSQAVDVCILIGPFVDARHKDIAEGKLRDTFDETFNYCMSMVGSFAKSLHTQFIIVPSLNDVHHHYIYPTPPFTKPKNVEKLQNIHFVSDPAVLSIDGLVVGVTATDVLFHLGREEISHPPGMPDRLGRLASHLLTQRSFYPLYPPPEELHVNFDMLDSHAHLPVTPHLLILPSDLNCFVKDVSGCCCVNPQRLTRGTAGGTYSRITISKDGKPEDPLINSIACKVVRV